MCLNGSFKMTAFRNRLLGLVAGTLALSSFSSMAYAQLEVLNFAGSTFVTSGISVFTFNQSLILNSIGFFDDGSLSSSTSYLYQISIPGGPGTFQLATAGTFLEVSNVINGVRYFNLTTPTTYPIGTTVAVYASDDGFSSFGRTGFLDNAVGVTHENNAPSASGNLRVTALGGSVAPEPGSLALALTGGATLLGICIRRRRNAA